MQAVSNVKTMLLIMHTFIAKIMRNPQIHCVDKMHNFLMLQHVVRRFTVGFKGSSWATVPSEGIGSLELL